jgi:phosphoglycolate phosphatase
VAVIRCQKLEYSNIKAIIFDKDGTLEDSQNFFRELGIRRVRAIDAKIPGIGEPLLMAFGIDKDRLDPAGLMAVGTRYENEIAAGAYIAETGRSWFESLAIARQCFMEADLHLVKNAPSSPLFAGSLEVIRALADAGLRLGILSADTTVRVEEFVRRYRLESYIQMSMGADGGLSKPDPALLIRACQELGVEPSQTLTVGDSLQDIEMAKAAGAAGAIAICWGELQGDRLNGADVIITSLEEIQVISP